MKVTKPKSTTPLTSIDEAKYGLYVNTFGEYLLKDEDGSFVVLGTCNHSVTLYTNDTHTDTDVVVWRRCTPGESVTITQE